MEKSETEALDTVLREWIRDDLPTGIKMMMLPEHCDALVARLVAKLAEMDRENAAIIDRIFNDTSPTS